MLYCKLLNNLYDEFISIQERKSDSLFLLNLLTASKRNTDKDILLAEAEKKRKETF
jgi:hypothetical protein